MSNFYAYNLAGIRSLVFSQLDWEPAQSSLGKDRADQLINRAYRRMSQDAPYLFFEGTYRIRVLQDVEPSDDTDLLGFYSFLSAPPSVVDKWTFLAELGAANPLGVSWPTDGTWDGRILKVYDPDDEKWREFRIRTVTTVTPASTPHDPGVNHALITVDHPWPGSATTGLRWRVITREVPLPPEVITVKALRYDDGTARYPLRMITKANAEWTALRQNDDDVYSGTPRTAFVGAWQSLPAPHVAPKVSLVADAGINTWGYGLSFTPDYGSFEYVYTWSWGAKDVEEHFDAPETFLSTDPTTRRSRPRFESPPSPVSDVLTVVAGQHGYLEFPNIHQILGFNEPTVARYAKSGMNIRVYRRRVTAGSDLTPVSKHFYFLAEVDTRLVPTPAFKDLGTYVPDVTRPLRPQHGQQTVRMWPRPDEDTAMLEVRASRRPLQLLDDNDYPEIPEDAVEPLVLLASAYLYEQQGNMRDSAAKRQEYERRMVSLNKRYGNGLPKNRPLRRRVARAR